MFHSNCKFSRDMGAQYRVCHYDLLTRHPYLKSDTLALYMTTHLGKWIEHMCQTYGDLLRETQGHSWSGSHLTLSSLSTLGCGSQSSPVSSCSPLFIVPRTSFVLWTLSAILCVPWHLPKNHNIWSPCLLEWGLCQAFLLYSHIYMSWLAIPSATADVCVDLLIYGKRGLLSFQIWEYHFCISVLLGCSIGSVVWPGTK